MSRIKNSASIVQYRWRRRLAEELCHLLIPAYELITQFTSLENVALRISPFLNPFQHTAIQKKIQIFTNLFGIQITSIHYVRLSCTSITHRKYKFNNL